MSPTTHVLHDNLDLRSARLQLGHPSISAGAALHPHVSCDARKSYFNLDDFEQAAKDRLPRNWYDFFAGAESERSAARNAEAFAKLALHYRALGSVGEPDTTCSVFGESIDLPIMIGPTAFHRLAAVEGEIATARAAQQAGTVFIVSMASTTSLEDVAASVATDRNTKTLEKSKARLWLQLFVQPDRAVTTEMVRRAESAGYEALVVTVDSPLCGGRARDIRNCLDQLPEGLSLGNSKSLQQILEFKRDVSWADIDWLRGITSLPILLQGIVHPLDAKLAQQHGCQGVIVSDRGGRQLASAPATIDALASITSSVGDEMIVILDGGIRRGTDVVKALALGADAVTLGRPVIWGLAADGQEGVSSVLNILKNELRQAMRLCGTQFCAELSPELLHPSAASGAVRPISEAVSKTRNPQPRSRLWGNCG